MLRTPVSENSAENLQSLIDDGVREGKKIEFKRDLPGNRREDRKEFLADVSSFANTNGGFLIIGMDENDGIASELTGVPGTDLDSHIQRFENIIRSNIEPRLSGVEIHPVELDDDCVAIVLYIPRGWNRPYVVDHDGHWRFYGRNTAGKYPLDVQEVKSHAIHSQVFAEKVRRFREDRLSNIISNETPVALHEGARIVIHAVPADAYESDRVISVRDIYELQRTNSGVRLTWPFSYSSAGDAPNLDGLVTYSTVGDAKAAYVQVFRNGSIEAVDGYILNQHPSDSDPPMIHPREVEKRIVEQSGRTVDLLRQFGIDAPIAIMLSMIGVGGFAFWPGQIFDPDDLHSIVENHILLPDTVIEGSGGSVARDLRPAVDAFWNAGGHMGSPSYDKNGNWNPR